MKKINAFIVVFALLVALAFPAPHAFAVNSTPTNVTILPASGIVSAGIASNFTATYSDVDGYVNLKQTSILISINSTTLSNCAYLYYDQNANLIYLRNDANTAWLGGYAPGSSNIIENSQVKINCALCIVAGSGNVLTIVWNLTFKPAFSGKAYNTYLKAVDDSGALTSWVKKGTCTVSTKPVIGSITPVSGAGQGEVPQIFTATYIDVDGWQNIQTAQLLINTSTSGSKCFYAYYDQNVNKLFLRNDANTAWLGGYAPGSSYVIENSYAKLNCVATLMSGSGATLTINWSIILRKHFNGTKNTYLYVKDDVNAYIGLTKVGTWTLPNTTPQVVSITPSAGTCQVNLPQAFTTTFMDADGWQNISYVQFLINGSTSGSNCFYGYYVLSTNSLYIRNDANTAWVGGFSPGSTNVIENSYAKLDCSATTITTNGTTITINWSVTPKQPFIGNKNTYLYVRDVLNSYHGMIRKGTFTINSAPVDVPPVITANPVSSIKGQIMGGMLGYSMISVRDINGDGLGDMVISAPGIAAGTDFGKAYVFFGGDITKTPDMTLTGSSPGGCFGYSIASGDINGDGRGDIIIGEPFNNENGTKSGKAYIYFGGQSLSNNPSVVLKGQAAGDMFGCSMTCRDIDSDGKDDIVIGAPYNSGNGTNAGTVYVFFGGQNINSVAGLAMDGVTPGDLFGVSVASSNNIDGNNNGIIIGAPGFSGNTDRPGRAYVYFGGSILDDVADVVMAGQSNGDLFGCSVSAIDLNGDGCDDTIVGAEKNNSSVSGAGKAYIYYGGKKIAGTPAPALTMAGESTNDRFGYSVSSVGDLNGDGYGDLMVGSPNNNGATGKTYIYFGGFFMDNVADAVLSGEAAGDGFGASSCSGGDSDNDGVDELVIGAANNSLNGSNSGAAYIYKLICSDPPSKTPDVLIDETEAKACKYFYDQALITTSAYGLIKDTCYTDYAGATATGFGLTSLCIMANRYGTSPYWTVTPAQASARASATLDTLIDIQNKQASQENYYGKAGFFFRFIGQDGKREASVVSEVSTADTAVLLAGVLTAGKYFGGDIQVKANAIFNSVNWDYFLDTDNDLFYMGWNPDSGHIYQALDRLNDETLLTSILAIASDPDDQDILRAYYGFPRNRNNYVSASQTFELFNSYSGSLSNYILSHCWYDFNEAGPDIPQNVQGARFPVAVDWWENSKTAAQANRQFCIDNAASYSSCSQNDWGLSACFRPDGSYFEMNGAAPRIYEQQDGGEPANDGTVPPYGAISALPFMKDIETQGLASNSAYKALEHYYNDYYIRIWGPYGPRDSFDSSLKFSTVYSGASLGQIALMIENYRSGLIWNTFMQDAKISQVKNALFRDVTAPVIDHFSISDPASPTIGYAQSAIVRVLIDDYDAVGIVKWLITETAAQPSIYDFTSRGTDAKPAIYTIINPANGLKSLYAWAVDNGNNISALSGNSQAQIYLDKTPPSIGAVVTDGSSVTSTSQLHAGWSGQDNESGIIDYQYCITDGAANGPVVREWTSTSAAAEVTATGLSLLKGHTYYFNVKAMNASGLWSGISSSGGLAMTQSPPLIVNITPVEGSMLEIGNAVAFNISAIDPEGDALQYKIIVDGLVASDWNSAPGFEWQTSAMTFGPRQAVIYVKDTYGNECNSNVALYLARKTLDAPQQP